MRFSKENIIKHYTGVEAGYVNNPNDLGGETNHGITKAVANKHKTILVRRFGWDGNMRNLTTPMAYYIYEVDYWNRVRGDDLLRIMPAIADKMFDIAINMGTSRAVTYLQEFLNAMNNQSKLYLDLKVDGAIGNITISTLTTYATIRKVQGLKRLLHYLIAAQTHHYINISLGREQNETFTYGWIGRAYDSAEEYVKLGMLY